MPKRNRKLHSFKSELVTKSREAMLCAVSIFNNPHVVFKSESFTVLSNIAWTYLLHAYYRDKGIDYRYYEQKGVKKRFDKTKRGAYKYWELERCLNEKISPIDSVTSANLRFLIGLRHEIEHQMTTKIDDYLSARFQACCLNYNQYIKSFFGASCGIDKHLSFSLQFSSIEEDQIQQLRKFEDLPKNVSSYITDYDDSLSPEDYNNPRYSYRVLFVPKAAGRKGQADKVIEFIKADSPEAVGLNKEYVLIKDREKPKLLPGDIVKKMRAKGFAKFNLHHHTLVWKENNAKDPSLGYGVPVANTWYWYESWVPVVEDYCTKNKGLLT